MQSAADPRESLAQLAKGYWEERLFNEPLFATALGDRRFDDRLPDVSPAGRAKVKKQYESVVSRCREIPESILSDADRLTRTALLVDAGSLLDYYSCDLEDWTVDPLQGLQVELMNVESYQPVQTVSEGRAMVARWQAIGPYIMQHVANLRGGAAMGKVAVRACVEKVIDELEDLLAKPDDEWALLRPLGAEHQDWTEEERRAFKEGLTGSLRESARPGFARYLEFLNSEILPKTRPADMPGIMHVPGGREAYAKLIHVHTSLDLTPEEIHGTGLSEVERINKQMEVLGEKVFGTRERKEILQRLRSDTSLYFSTRDEVAAKAEKALSRANAAMAKWFGRLPKTPCEVVRMAEHEEKHSTIAYYRPPAADGSRPGRYYINASAPETRPRYEAEALAYHEAVPGHHLQIAIAQELEGIPEFRKNSGVTAFIEGWGLYSERLADEMGLYSSDLDRIGILSFDSWRACRLVVDTGMHAMGWTRDQAINFMLENTALAKNNIVTEVDRYITWPGQALAYKTGQLEIVGLRKGAKSRLGTKFDVRKFHDALLDNGAVPLQVLRQVIRNYSNQ
ncbi:MAG TPA: DUF885 domain-containing protein [Nitrososphaerales archaeon]|nr:DUF885 domain-containing protein [Nitrososphaerales archaeon]